MDDSGGCADTVGDGGGIDVEPRQVIHGVDDAVDVLGGDESGTRGDHASGKGFLVVGIGLVVADVGVGGGKAEGGGEVGGVAQIDGAGATVRIVERNDRGTGGTTVVLGG